MKYCFVCKREYDEINRRTVTSIMDIYTGEQYPVKRIGGEAGSFAMLCPNCTKAAVIFGCKAAVGRLKCLENIYYEDGTVEEYEMKEE